MTTVETPARVIQEPLADTVRRLETFVGRMERRYECLSSFAVEAVACGQMKETAEVARWLISYRTLQRLRDYGPETGMSTTSTG